MNILVPRSKPKSKPKLSSSSSSSSSSSTITTTTAAALPTIINDTTTQKYIQLNKDLKHGYEQPSYRNTTPDEDLPALYDFKFRAKNPLTKAYQDNEAKLNRMGKVMTKGTFDNINYSAMRSFISHSINKDGGETFFGDMLGFTDFISVVNYNRSKQVKHVQRVQQPLHVQRCKVRIPSFLNLYQAVERYCVEVYRGLEIMYFDILHQGLATSNVYTLHQDNDYNNNPGGASIYRSLVVKISEGISVSVSVAGHPIMHYENQAGSFVDFRSDAWHQSVMPTDSGFVENYKIVFFLGRNGEIDDGRYPSEEEERVALEKVSKKRKTTLE